MPITLPNFLGVAPQREVPDIFNEMLKGYKMSQEPRKMREEAMARQLAIEMAKMQNQYYPKIQDQNLQKGDIDIQSGQLNLNALPQKIQDDALTRALSIGQSKRDADRDIRFGDELVEAALAQKRAAAQRAAQGPDPIRQMRTQQLINSHYWNSLPASAKDRMIALANGLSIRPDEFVTGMTQGRTFEDIAADKGYSREDVANTKARYLATSGNVRMENERQKNLAELNVIEDKVSDAMAPYISTYGGFSIPQIVDSFKGKDPDKLARYLAARSLQPELAAIRIKVMGGLAGQGAIEELVKSSLGNTRVIQGLVTPEVYKKMQHYVKQWLNEGSKAATESIFGSGSTTSSANNKITVSKPLLNISDEELAGL